MSVEITKILWRKRLEPVSVKFVFMCLCSHANPDGGNARPSVDTISAETGVSRASVYDALKGLKDQGLLIVSRKASRRTGLCTNYAIGLKALHALPDLPARVARLSPSPEEIDAGESPITGQAEIESPTIGLNPEMSPAIGLNESSHWTLTTSGNHQEEGTTLPSLRSGNAPAQEGMNLEPLKPSQRQQLESIGVRVAAVIPDDVPVAAMVASYHQRVPSGSKLIKITAPRVAALRRVWRDIGRTPEAWKAFLDRVEASDWLTGRRTDRDGGAFSALDLDWITGAKNFEKITGGRYDNRDGNRHNSARSVAGKTAKELWPNLV